MSSPLPYPSALHLLLVNDPQYRSLCRDRGQTHAALVRATMDPSRFEVELVRRLQAEERAALEALRTYLLQQAAAHPEAEPPSWIRKGAPSRPAI